MPVVVDGTRDQDAFVPDAFRAVQWTRLPGGDTPPVFVERIKRLLSPELSPLSAVSSAAPGIGQQVPPSRRWSRFLMAIAAVLVLAAPAYFWISTHWTPSAAAFAPPPHSIAVLPFVNMSGDKEQEYFSDGLTEELLNSLAEINELQVAARTSAFSFKGTNTDIGTIARKLNVGAVLEGSVRRSGNTVRVTTQLINAVTGYHLWSHTYDRDLGDVLKLETEIAGAVASALKVNLLGDVVTKIELGGTRNPAAFDAYLRGSKPLSSTVGDAAALRAAITAFTDAIHLDPNYALAFADRALAQGRYASEYATDSAAFRVGFDKALIDARQAITLAPELAEGYRALAYIKSSTQQYAEAGEAYERAIKLSPGNARVLPEYSRFAAFMGHADAGIVAGHRAVVLDPLNSNGHFSLGMALRSARRYAEAVAAFDSALALEPDNARILTGLGLAYYGLGNLEGARSTCETKTSRWLTQWCLAVVYDKLGRHSDAEDALAKLKGSVGNAGAYQIATIYAQWGNREEALAWLDTALRVRDPGLIFLKTDPFMDPLRKEPRFQAVMRELKFSD